MALGPISSGTGKSANDLFDRHYAEKIWDLIPEVYRHEDGIAERPGQLRALIEITAKQAAHQRRSIDRLLADSRIGEADDWAIAYIGELLGTRLLDPRNSAGRRADVGKTLSYRRRAGTVRLLEDLAGDVADWDAIGHEGFRHLLRHPHKWERYFERGLITGTPRGGYPDTRNTRIGDTAYGPFEDAAHYPAIRRAGRGGPVYGIADVSLHVFRKQAFGLSGVTPWEIDPTHFTLDPSGRGHVPLYQPGLEHNDDCRIPREWDIRQAINCRRLGDVRYALPEGEELIDSDFAPLSGRSFTSARALKAAAIDAGITDTDDQLELLKICLLKECPKAQLIDNDLAITPALRLELGGKELRPENYAAAGLQQWADDVTLDPDVAAMIDPMRGLVQLRKAVKLDPQVLHYGAYRGIGAGGYERPESMATARLRTAQPISRARAKST